MKLSKVCRVVFWLVIAVSSRMVYAHNDGEKASLVRLIHELDALRPLLKEAEAQALTDTRIRLNYTWLSQDLERIKTGIREYIDTPSTEPRHFPPLQGDYRQ